MTRALEADYGETYLFPPAIEDWVSADHPARFIREVVEALDLEAWEVSSEGGRKEAEQGRPHYAPQLLLKAWLYGYLNGIRSQRKLERACRENVGLIWLLGRHEPDHNTLWRFWRRHQEAIAEVFRQVVRIGREAEVIGVVLHALDGTKIQARASSRMSRTLRRQDLQKQEEVLDEWIAEIEAEIERNSTGEQQSEYRLPEELAEPQRLRRKVREAMERLDETGKNHLNPREPEAQMMPCEGKKRLAYNAQSVVDEQSGMIVAEKVSAQATDHFELLPMLDETRENLGESAQDTVADAGYRTDANIGKAAEKKYSVLVNLYEREGERASAYASSRFRYDQQADCCICPRGRKLIYAGQRRSRHGWLERLYRCVEAQECSEAKQCSSSPRGRYIRIGPYYEAVLQQRQRQQLAEAQEKLGQRKAIVEPVFAHIKHNMGFRRWTFGSLSGVQAQWAMICTVYNLKKLMKLWRNGQLQLAG